MTKQEVVELIIEYVKNDDVMECDFTAMEAAVKSLNTGELKPTSTINRLLINAELYIDAGPGNAARGFYHKMVEEVNLIEAGI